MIKTIKRQAVAKPQPAARSNRVSAGPVAPRAPDTPQSFLGNTLVQLLLLTIGATGANYARFAIGPLQETIRAALALSDNQIALLQGPALALPLVAVSVPLGLLIDRKPRVRLLLASAVGTALGSLATALVTNFFLLLAIRCMVGLTAIATLLVTISLLADLSGPARRGRATMLIILGGAGGTSLAFGAGGALLGHLGTGADMWRTALLWLTLPLFPIALLMLLVREPARRGAAAHAPTTRGAFAELWRFRHVIAPLLGGAIMVGIADGAAIIWAGPALARGFTLPPAQVGGIMATMFLVSGVVAPIAGGFLADWSQSGGGPRRTMAVVCGLALISVPGGLFAVAPSIAGASLCLILFMSIGASINMMVTTLCTLAVPSDVRGLCLTLKFTVNLIFGLALAPLLISLLSGALGGPAMIGRALAIVCVATSLFGAITFALGYRYTPRQAAA